MNALSTSEKPTRVCSVTSCDKVLRSHNQSGFCREHRDQSEKYKKQRNEAQARHHRLHYADNRENILLKNSVARWKKYGVDVDEVLKSKNEHDGLCDICGQPSRSKRGETPIPLVMDHDHITGKFRGWLCNDCNRGVGIFGDDPEKLSAAASYITRGGGKK